MYQSNPGSTVVLEEGMELVQGRQFHEREYLEMNPDVRAAVASGQLRSGREHFVKFGLAEGRLGCSPLKRSEFFGETPVDFWSLGAFRASRFPYAGPHPWLDRPDWAERIEAKVARGELTEADAAQCRFWAERGYVILKNCVEPEVIDAGWAAYERAIAEGRVTVKPEPAGEGDPWPGRALDPHEKVPELCGAMRHPEIMRWINILTEREPAPFQSLAFYKGSQQAEHSDSIHMTTYPLGYLTASWIAFEDIHPDSGPLVYFPGSHRLPYIFSDDVGIGVDDFRVSGYKGYVEKYEPAIKQLLADNHCTSEIFLPKKGDALIWHANLIHGGSARKDLKHSRRSLVCHYFVKGAVTYHDLAATSARPHLGTCMVQKPGNS